MAEKNIPMREALRAALREEMLRDERVFVMGEEVGAWDGTHKVTRGFLDEFGERRVRDTPISEMAIVGAAVGAAMAGLRPVAEIMTINFAFLAFDALINHAAKVHYMFDGQFKVPMVVRAATGWGNQATATHSHTPEPIFAHFPGMYLGCPSTPADAKGMLKAAIRDDNPVLFTEVIALYPKPGLVPDDPDFVLPIGKGDIKRAGKDVTIVTYGRGVEWSLDAAEILAREGISCEVVDVRWLRPLDLPLIFESFKKTNRCVVVEESLPFYSFGSEIAAQLQEHMFDYMDAPIKRVSAMDVPLPYAKEIELMALPDAHKVVAAVKEII
ncbi:MAG: alpha-ketoacid dehydrogenase subunit beta [Candidatus Thermofonsia Clade 1 bacterium]|jgi:pyruvate dehydrogenase E1 component beta subunit|uniref:Alpha-ketoacid dehydrogenase subunit beta n=1 Tax=Candidatus Thermofonsia Clade 1 bacterium TaxID=2364210 RepID=A0A2M8PEN0_9CHLR|nr:MAG: alpha-ketoacid dehydrogenase subunit beta [Candidatus Thermofonsia Clade 1 bacterium]PJF43280.1 MAG: alpha-ketoacid dehydrogenase subunit beta [Candidatus Thermofonsia Clade 1 bacterium]